MKGNLFVCCFERRPLYTMIKLLYTGFFRFHDRYKNLFIVFIFSHFIFHMLFYMTNVIIEYANYIKQNFDFTLEIQV